MTAARAPVDPAPALEVLFELRFSARPDRLKLIRPAVLAAARMCGFAEEAGHDVVLAVDEACQNIIVHGYRGREDATIYLTAYRAEAGITVQLRDFAPTVNQADIRPRDLDDLRPGGLGTHFIGAAMDEVTFLRPPDGAGNLLQLTKILKGHP